MKTLLLKRESLLSNNTVSLILRLLLGVLFIAHGSQKVLGLFGGYGLEGTTTWMHAKLGIPYLFAYISCFAEFFGGIGLVLGFFTRFWGLAIAINMLVAMLSAHKGFFAPSGIEFPLTLMVVAFTVLIIGPGKYSIDSLFIKDK